MATPILTARPPLGTYVQDGVRTGPLFTRQTNTQVTNGVLLSGNHLKNGPGILMSPLVTWDFVPYATTDGNVVAELEVAAAGYMTLTQDEDATVLVTPPSGIPYIQLDWPRVIAVEVIGAAMTGATAVTIFGEDFYGFPMQHTYTVNAVGVYPANMNTGAKAFYRVTSVYVNGTTGVGGSIRLQTTSKFGLPYRLRVATHLIQFQWNSTSLMDWTGDTTLVAGTDDVSFPGVRTGTNIFVSRNTPGGTIGHLSVPSDDVESRTGFVINSSDALDTSTVYISIPGSGYALVEPGLSTGASTATTTDVRGLFQLPEPGEGWASPPNGSARATLTYYVLGADMYKDQLAALGQRQGASTVPALTSDDLYGVAQYYTGVAA